MKIKRVCILIILLLLATGCQDVAKIKEKAFVDLVQFEQWDEKIVMKLYNISDGKKRFMVRLDLENNTEKLIGFPKDYGVKIYKYNSDTQAWNQLTNNTEYYVTGDQDVIPAILSNPSSGGLVLFTLEKSEVPQFPVEVRVMVQGYYLDENGNLTNEIASNYVDVTIDP